jgi:hypothetical protein
MSALLVVHCVFVASSLPSAQSCNRMASHPASSTPTGRPPARSVRTLPIRLPPVAGEGLDSYLEALAERCDAAWSDILNAIGPKR